MPAIYTESKQTAYISDYVAGNAVFGTAVTQQGNYGSSLSLAAASNALSESIATALSITPFPSPASGVIIRLDPETGVALPVSSTLGPIFTERAETIGKHRLYIGFSHEDFHFTKFNGQSLNSLTLFNPGGDTSISKILVSPSNPTPVGTTATSFSIGGDLRLSEDIAFLTFGLTDRFDVSVGLPMVHASMAARTYNGLIYAGTGWGGANSACWCVSTFSPGSPLLELPVIGQASQSATGFGDLLVRLKGSVIARKRTVLAVGADLRFATGDAQNYLGTGTTSVKPFMAFSFYSQRLGHGIVVAPHLEAGWQFSGKSILAADLSPTQTAGPGGTPQLTTPFTYGPKDYLPDVFSWAAGAEVALGRRNTIAADFLFDEIGLIHGIWNATPQSISGQYLPEGAAGTGPPATAGDFSSLPQPTQASPFTAFVNASRVSYAQTRFSIGYKVKLVGNLIANVNLLFRLDNNGLVARWSPLYGIGYSF